MFRVKKTIKNQQCIDVLPSFLMFYINYNIIYYVPI